MARVNFRLPDIGEGIAEAEIVAWHVKVGDSVEEDQPVADMMTDKATVEMAAPVTGRIVELAGAVGDQIPIGSTLVVFETEAEPAAEATASPVGDGRRRSTRRRLRMRPLRSPSRRHPAECHPAGPRSADPRSSRASTSLGTSGEGASSHGSRKVLASPAVRQRAKELHVDLADVHPAAGDRVKHSDLDAFLKYSGGARPASAPSKPRRFRRRRHRGNQGHRPAPPHRREHGRGQAPHPAFRLCRGD